MTNTATATSLTLTRTAADLSGGAYEAGLRALVNHLTAAGPECAQVTTRDGVTREGMLTGVIAGDLYLGADVINLEDVYAFTI